jgi:hypothetical protein
MESTRQRFDDDKARFITLKKNNEWHNGFTRATAVYQALSFMGTLLWYLSFKCLAFSLEFHSPAQG